MEVESVDLDDSCLTWALETKLWDGRPITWEEAPQFSLEVGEKVMQLLFSKDPTSYEFHQMAAHLALLTAHPSERLGLAKEIQPILPAKFGKTVSKIWKEHKVAIIVSAALIATAIVIVVVTTTTAGTATAPIAAAGGAALDSLCNSPGESKKKIPTASPPKIVKAPPPPLFQTTTSSPSPKTTKNSSPKATKLSTTSFPPTKLTNTLPRPKPKIRSATTLPSAFSHLQECLAKFPSIGYQGQGKL